MCIDQNHVLLFRLQVFSRFRYRKSGGEKPSPPSRGPAIRNCCSVVGAIVVVKRPSPPTHETAPFTSSPAREEKFTKVAALRVVRRRQSQYRCRARSLASGYTHKKQLTVGKSKTDAGTGRVIPLNDTV